MSRLKWVAGFLNRYVILHIVRPKLVALPRRTTADEIDRIASQVADIVRFASGGDVTGINGLEITLSGEAARFWCERYPNLTAEYEGIAGALLVRTEMYARMLSMIFALLDKSTVVEVIHIKAALAWVRYWRDSVQYIFATMAAKAAAEQLHEDAANVLIFIKQNPGCSRTDLTTFFKNKTSASQITECLNHLMNAAPPLVRYESLKRPGNTKGRGKTTYYVMN